ncbi:MAG: hypothetical protein ABI330_01040 [Caldimonas sp.]
MSGNPPKTQLEVLADPDALARRVADWLLGTATESVGFFGTALSGGSTLVEPAGAET